MKVLPVDRIFGLGAGLSGFKRPYKKPIKPQTDEQFKAGLVRAFGVVDTATQSETPRHRRSQAGVTLDNLASQI